MPGDFWSRHIISMNRHIINLHACAVFTRCMHSEVRLIADDGEEISWHELIGDCGANCSIGQGVERFGCK